MRSQARGEAAAEKAEAEQKAKDEAAKPGPLDQAAQTNKLSERLTTPREFS